MNLKHQEFFVKTPCTCDKQIFAHDVGGMRIKDSPMQ